MGKLEEAKLLKSIPGISTFSALVILAEMGDVNRFPDEKKIFSYGWISSICSQLHIKTGGLYIGVKKSE